MVDETGLYYLQSRYYDPTTGRFINADIMVSTGQGILGANMFAYCQNNPVSCYDSNGKWTISISISFEWVFGTGESDSWSIVFDGKGNIDFQKTYANGKDGTKLVGGIGIGVGPSIQFTNNETVYDLYGYSTTSGVNVNLGSPFYIGGDIVTDTYPLENGSINGFQINSGLSFGLPISPHIVRTRTISLREKNRVKSESSVFHFSPRLRPLQFQKCITKGLLR